MRVKDLFNVADILFNLIGSDSRRLRVRIIFEDEAHLTNIVANTSGRIASCCHYLLQFKQGSLCEWS